uniref:ANTAR domain-containing protein n=1 Tax=Streptomyces sp. NBC_00003 TaxID=2903608 RepID=A0AAU2VEA0_9ACTN
MSDQRLATNRADVSGPRTQLAAEPSGCPLTSDLGASMYPCDDRVIVVASGEIDIDTASQLHDVLTAALDTSRSGIDLDLSRVTFCDCCGLNALLRVRHRAVDQDKTLLVRAAGAPLIRLLTFTHTLDLLTAASGVTFGADAPCPVQCEREPESPGSGQSSRSETDQLRQALQTRPVIDMARGVLMASYQLTPDQAWHVLVDVSQHTNTKLHHLAQSLLGTVQGPPLPAPVRKALRQSVTRHSPATPTSVRAPG